MLFRSSNLTNALAHCRPIVITIRQACSTHRKMHCIHLVYSYEMLLFFLQSLCCGFPNKNDNLTRYQENLSAFQTLRWDHYWKLHVLPLIKKSQLKSTLNKTNQISCRHMHVTTKNSTYMLLIQQQAKIQDKLVCSKYLLIKVEFKQDVENIHVMLQVCGLGIAACSTCYI